MTSATFIIGNKNHHNEDHDVPCCAHGLSCTCVGQLCVCVCHTGWWYIVILATVCSYNWFTFTFWLKGSHLVRILSQIWDNLKQFVTNLRGIQESGNPDSREKVYLTSTSVVFGLAKKRRPRKYNFALRNLSLLPFRFIHFQFFGGWRSFCGLPHSSFILQAFRFSTTFIDGWSRSFLRLCLRTFLHWIMITRLHYTGSDSWTSLMYISKNHMCTSHFDILDIPMYIF